MTLLMIADAVTVTFKLNSEFQEEESESDIIWFLILASCGYYNVVWISLGFVEAVRLEEKAVHWSWSPRRPAWLMANREVVAVGLISTGVRAPRPLFRWEDAQPTDGEREVWNQISAVLQDSESMLADLQAYKGAGQEIRDAIQNPNDIQLQEKAWNSVCPLVVRLKRFYEFSLRLEKALQSLLESLTCPPYTPTQHLEREQALAKEFAEILHFTLRFDELKMRNPAIQNDFSYYRRTISRNRINNMHLDIENEVNNEMANRMSLFYAEATPMLKTLSNATTHFVSENKTLPIENTTDCLSTMASVCKVMLETPEYRSRFTSEETLMFCMRVMVGVIILYDHVHPVGAFSKTSKIDMKGCIKVLKEQPPDSVEGLLNALRFTTKHLNDESTSKQIRAMLQ
uniref:CYFIP related Rac1 interactor A n=6 Tax=Passeriformes TaxID=9126 RepID=A0A8C0UQK7_CYACU